MDVVVSASCFVVVCIPDAGDRLSKRALTLIVDCQPRSLVSAWSVHGLYGQSVTVKDCRGHRIGHSRSFVSTRRTPASPPVYFD